MDFNFQIRATTPISLAFITKNITDFHQASQFIKMLPYKRNSDKNDPLIVLKEQIGTCSTKHALLKRLANENEIRELKLMQGIFKMNVINTPIIKKILGEANLKYIPEAHNYFKLNNKLLDFTKPGFPLKDFEYFLLDEIEVAPEETNEFKIKYLKNFFIQWIKENSLPYSETEMWNIREACIKQLSSDN